ncbi:methionine--tRNA ligase [Mycoplasma sp. SG1]|uniref:methionine--tRNA ligase n=1 Tax=Mycoplasma sp. SG1 TaxID=2810348 RepID=UPI002024210A|nr:methionine--tRNA ligase [Mycoplasma sp. SG1]URM52850.1 methionine--tRNA ligase [Mycoplasma sp. SG1]
MLKNKKNIFISTPIYYINSNLHLGHCYTTVLADIYNRFQKKILQNNTFFVTGCDVHGEKVFNSAKEALKKENISTDDLLSLINEKQQHINELWSLLDIKTDYFISTHDENHIKNVQKIFSFFYDNQNIYLGKYKGYYSEVNECYYSYKEIKEKKIDIHSLKKIEEQNYFLNLNKIKNKLEDVLKKDILIPEYRRTDVLNYFFKKNNLLDLSITRSKSNVHWGITNPIDNKSIIYVWFDALINYLTALNYGEKNNELFKKFWSVNSFKVQFIGKEIIRFHSIYWPAILFSLNLPIPDKLVSHGWLIYKDEKMSKSKKNIVDPFLFLKTYDFEYLRYFFMYNGDLRKDFNFSEEEFKVIINSTLIDNFGNFINRVLHLINKNFNGYISFEEITNKQHYQQIINDYLKYLNGFEFSKGLNYLLNIIREQNKHLNETGPWKQINIKNNREYLNYFKNYFIIINIIFFLLSPVFTKSYKLFLNHFTVNSKKAKTILEGNLKEPTLDMFSNLSYFQNKIFKIKLPIKIIFKKIDK